MILRSRKANAALKMIFAFFNLNLYVQRKRNARGQFVKDNPDTIIFDESKRYRISKNIK